MKQGLETARRVPSSALNRPKTVAGGVDKVVGHDGGVCELEKFEHQAQPLLQAVPAGDLQWRAMVIRSDQLIARGRAEKGWVHVLGVFHNLGDTPRFDSETSVPVVLDLVLCEYRDVGNEAGIEGTQKVGAWLVRTFAADQVWRHVVHQDVVEGTRLLDLLEDQTERLVLSVPVPCITECVGAGLELDKILAALVQGSLDFRPLESVVQDRGRQVFRSGRSSTGGSAAADRRPVRRRRFVGHLSLSDLFCQWLEDSSQVSLAGGSEFGHLGHGGPERRANSFCNCREDSGVEGI